MKIYNKKGFLLGAAELAFAVAMAVGYIIIWEISIKGFLLTLMMFVFGLISLTSSLSKEETEKDLARDDERSKLIQLNLNSMRYRILMAAIWAAVIGGCIYYGFTENINIVIALLPLFILLTVWFISSLILIFYYERKF